MDCLVMGFTVAIGLGVSVGRYCVDLYDFFNPHQDPLRLLKGSSICNCERNAAKPRSIKPCQTPAFAERE